MGLVIAAVVVGPLGWRANANLVKLADAFNAPSLSHPFGTDENGRDMLSRFDEGARISLLAGLAVTALGAVIGGSIGLLAGMARGIVDSILMRALDGILAFPPLILAMGVCIGFGQGINDAVIGIALTTVPYYARLLRSDVLRVRELPHIEAARALGARPHTIALRHILPFTLPTMLVQAAAVFGQAILLLAGLGFVGLGAQVPTPEWGSMITDGLQYTLTGKWWIAVFPGIGLLVVVTSANLFADWAQTALDPRRVPVRG